MTTTNGNADPPAMDEPPKVYRPNYRRIHAKSLPLETFPLPLLIPHNPLSLLQIAYVYLSHLISRPSSHSSLNNVHGYFNHETNSVHITDAASVRLVWERGFFGKGNLSRSEPTWLDREKKRLGLLATETSEEYTQQRREERRRMKTERAKKEREAIEEELLQERDGTWNTRAAKDSKDFEPMQSTHESHAQALAFSYPESPAVNNLQEPFPQSSLPTVSGDISTEQPAQGKSSLDRKQGAKARELAQIIQEGIAAVKNPFRIILTDLGGQPDETSSASAPKVANQEHLQLTAEEAFFLNYGLGTLSVLDPTSNHIITTPELLTLFRSHSYFPPLDASSVTPHDTFLPSYAAYHHFRSLGWVVRPGIKFAVDWLLYLRGPAFAHAEFAVLVLPAFRDDYWWEDARRDETKKREKRDWWWLHCLQRVQAQVRKGLIICWVEIPSPDAIAGSIISSAEREAAEATEMDLGMVEIGKMMKQYKVREMMINRWIPNRSRD